MYICIYTYISVFIPIYTHMRQAPSPSNFKRPESYWTRISGVAALDAHWYICSTLYIYKYVTHVFIKQFQETSIFWTRISGVGALNTYSYIYSNLYVYLYIYIYTYMRHTSSLSNFKRPASYETRDICVGALDAHWYVYSTLSIYI